MDGSPSNRRRTSAGEVELDVGAPVARARVAGKLDHELLQELQRLQQAAQGAGDRTSLVIDLSRVSYVSSSGYAGLAKLSADRDVRLAAPTRAFRDTASVLGLDVLLRIFDDVGEATAATPRASAARPGSIS